jgi:hypothetical protein
MITTEIIRETWWVGVGVREDLENKPKEHQLFREKYLPKGTEEEWQKEACVVRRGGRRMTNTLPGSQEKNVSRKDLWYQMIQLTYIRMVLYTVRSISSQSY